MRAATSLFGLSAAGTGVLDDHDLVHAPPAAAATGSAAAGTWAVRLRARRLSKPASANTLRVSAAQKSVAAAGVGARRGAWWSRPCPTLRGVDLHSRHCVRAKAERPSHRCRRHLDGGSSLPGRRYCARACRNTTEVQSSLMSCRTSRLANTPPALPPPATGGPAIDCEAIDCSGQGQSKR